MNYVLTLLSSLGLASGVIMSSAMPEVPASLMPKEEVRLQSVYNPENQALRKRPMAEKEEYKDGDIYPLAHNVHNYPLEADYVPVDLVAFADYGIKTTKGSVGDEVKGSKIMMEDLKNLIDFCEAETEQEIYVRSGYRSYYTQKITYSQYGADYSAYPGTSEHQLGLAIDIEAHSYKTKSFLSADNPIYICFHDHAYDYGFIQSYHEHNPYGYKEEPWHWRYVGKEQSEQLVEEGSTEEPWKLFGVTPVEKRTPLFVAQASIIQEEEESFHPSAESVEDEERKAELRKKVNRLKMEARLKQK